MLRQKTIGQTMAIKTQVFKKRNSGTSAKVTKHRSIHKDTPKWFMKVPETFSAIHNYAYFVQSILSPLSRTITPSPHQKSEARTRSQTISNLVGGLKSFQKQSTGMYSLSEKRWFQTSSYEFAVTQIVTSSCSPGSDWYSTKSPSA